MRRWLLGSRDGNQSIKGPQKARLDALSTRETPEQGREHQVDEVMNVHGTGEVRAGDSVILWRRGLWRRDRDSGIVAIGRVVESVRALDLSDLWPDSRRPDTSPSETKHAVRLRFDTILTSTPLSRRLLHESSLTTFVHQGERIRQGAANFRGRLYPVEVTDADMKALKDLASKPPPQPVDSSSAWVIQPGRWVSRSELHSVYGGNPRLNATMSADTPNAFLISRRVDEIRPRWSGDTLLIPGAIQHIKYATTENLAVIGHVLRGMSLRVFELDGRRCMYVGEFLIDQDRPVEHWEPTGDDRIVPILRLTQLNGLLRFEFGQPIPRKLPRIRLRLRISCDPAETRPAAGGHNDQSTSSEEDAPSPETLRRLVRAFERDPHALDVVGELEETQMLAALVQHARRRSDLVRLEAVINDPATGELELQTQLETMTWIFGAEFLTETARRTLHVKHQLDLPLIRPDGSLHIVELKVARIGSLVVEYREGLIPAGIVSKAVGQARNYLVALDENRHQILNDFGIDTRRASVTIVAGHTGFVSNGATPDQIAETLRNHNAHDSRVKVMTYDQLIDNARRAIQATEPPSTRR